MTGITVTKRFTFEYAHFLPEYNGKCKELHGHSGVLEVEVSSNPNCVYGVKGMVCDFSVLSDLVKSRILSELDHKCINHLGRKDLPEWEKMRYNPTAENIVEWIVVTLQMYFGLCLERVRLWETRDSYAQWRCDA